MKKFLLLSMIMILLLCACTSEPSSELVDLCKKSLQLEKFIRTELKAGHRGPELDRAIMDYKKVSAAIERNDPEIIYRAEKRARGEK